MNPCDPYSQQSPGPLGDIQNQIASVLNANGDRPSIYIPGGPGEPVIQVPSPRVALAEFFAIFRRNR